MASIQASFQQLPNVIQEALSGFPDRLELALPELSGAPPYSSKDTGRFGIIVIYQKSKSPGDLYIRRNYMNEKVEKIADSSVAFLTPILHVEDCESPEANTKGSYTISRLGWKVQRGGQGSGEAHEELFSTLQSLISQNIVSP